MSHNQTELNEIMKVMRATSLSDIKDPEELRSRILLYLSHAAENGCLVKYSTLSRRFSVIAHRLGHRIRPVVDAMVADGLIHVIIGDQGQLIMTEANAWESDFRPMLPEGPDAAEVRANFIRGAW